MILNGFRQKLNTVKELEKEFSTYWGPLDKTKEILGEVTDSFINQNKITKNVSLAETALAVKRVATAKATAAATAAESLKATTSGLSALTDIISSLTGKVKGAQGILKGLFNFIPQLFKGGAAAKGLAGAFGGLLKAVAGVAGYIIGIVAALSIIAMLLEGLIKLDFKEIFHGKVANALAGLLDGAIEWLSNIEIFGVKIFGGTYKSVKTLEKEAQQLQEQIGKLNSLRIEIKGLDKEKIQIIQDSQWDEFLPNRQINILRGRAKDFNNQLNEITKEIFELEDKDSKTYKNLVGDLTGNEATIKVKERIAELKKQENTLLQSQLDVESKIKDIKQKLYETEIDMFNKMQEYQHQYKTALAGFNFGYDKSGKFVDTSDKANVKELERYLRSVKLAIGAFSFSGQDSKEGLQNLLSLRQQEFKTAQEIAQARIQALNEEREATINNLKSMYNFLNSTIKYTATTQEAVSASSLKAIEYQSRRRDGVNKTELAPIIENQKQVKTIEARLLRVQEEAKDSLRGIADATKKTYEKLRQKEGVILTVDPFR